MIYSLKEKKPRGLIINARYDTKEKAMEKCAKYNKMSGMKYEVVEVSR